MPADSSVSGDRPPATHDASSYADLPLICGIPDDALPQSFYARRGKRLLDVLGALVLLVPLGPVLLLLVLVVAITSGRPVFFRQERMGYQCSVFRIFKFRTMVRDAESKGAGLYLADDDDRITWAGRWLRATSLDELPQVFNVLLGDMSFVGPRPNLPMTIHRYRDYYDLILTVKPGITGLAAVRGRSHLRRSQMLALDQEYAQTVSLLTDLRILAASIPVVLLRRGALGPKTEEYMEDLDPPGQTLTASGDSVSQKG